MLYQTQIIKSDAPNNLAPTKNPPRSRGATDGSYPRSAAPHGAHGSFPARVGSHDQILGSDTIPWNWYLYIYIYLHFNGWFLW